MIFLGPIDDGVLIVRLLCVKVRLHHTTGRLLEAHRKLVVVVDCFERFRWARLHSNAILIVFGIKQEIELQTAIVKLQLLLKVVIELSDRSFLLSLLGHRAKASYG